MIASIPSRFRDMNLVVKLPAFMVGLVAVAIIVTSVAAYFMARNAMMREVEGRLTAVSQAPAARMSDLLATIDADLNALTQDRTVIEAMRAFSGAFARMDAPEAELQRNYIEDNPNPTGDKHLLDSAATGSSCRSRSSAIRPSCSTTSSVWVPRGGPSSTPAPSPRSWPSGFANSSSGATRPRHRSTTTTRSEAPWGCRETS